MLIYFLKNSGGQLFKYIHGTTIHNAYIGKIYLKKKVLIPLIDHSLEELVTAILIKLLWKIAYASKSLNSSQQQYAQIEKEALPLYLNVKDSISIFTVKR